MDRFRMEASPDLMSTPFGAYDAAIIQAIQQRWFVLLDGTPSARSASGKVLLNFDLMADGSIANMSVVEDRWSDSILALPEGRSGSPTLR